jgi:hypothetical protein
MGRVIYQYLAEVLIWDICQLLAVELGDHELVASALDGTRLSWTEHEQ